MEGLLERNNCDNTEVFEFLKLIKRKKDTTTQDFTSLNKENWSKVVNKSMKNSASSNKRITNVIVQFYNTIIVVQFFLERFLKTLAVII